MADKFLTHEYRPGEEFIVRFSLPGFKNSTSSLVKTAREVILGVLVVTRNLIDATIDYLEQPEDEEPVIDITRDTAE